MSVQDFVETTRTGISDMIRVGSDIAKKHPETVPALVDQFLQSLRATIQTTTNLQVACEGHLTSVKRMQMEAAMVSHFYFAPWLFSS